MNDLTLAALLRRLAILEGPLPDTPQGRLAAEFFAGNWETAQPLLASAPRLRVTPHSAAYRTFDFEFALPFKHQPRPGDPVTIAPGPIRGTIVYRHDPFTLDTLQPAVCVLVDSALGMLHPNVSRAYGAVCLGRLPDGPIALDALLEHLHAVLSYANVSTEDPADPAAAAWFVADPDPLAGLPPSRPLWGRGAA